MNNSQDAFPTSSEFLDSDILRLSGHSMDLFDSGFDFLDCDERIFADSTGSNSMMPISQVSCATIKEDKFENLEGSLDNMHVDVAEQDHDEIMRTSYNTRPSNGSARRSQSLRARSPIPQARPRFQMNEVSFDPPTQQPRRQMSHSDLSMSSAPESSAPEGSALCSSSHSLNIVSEESQINYNEALMNLAESMKRTEESRKAVMMQRTMLTPAQQQVIYCAKEQMQQRVEVTPTQNAQGQRVNARSLSPGNSSIMTAFFSGSRGTLTNGLDDSRRKLTTYMIQMNNQTM